MPETTDFYEDDESADEIRATWEELHPGGAMDVQEPDYESWAWKHRNGAMSPPEGERD